MKHISVDNLEKKTHLKNINLLSDSACVNINKNKTGICEAFSTNVIKYFFPDIYM